MSDCTFDAGTHFGDVSETHFCANGTEAGDAALHGSSDARPPIEGITSRSNNAEETHGTDGGFAWQSSEGHTVELHPDGFFRIEGADGSVFEREPFEALQGENATHLFPGDASDFKVDADGTFHWTDGHGTFVEVGPNGDAAFARENGSVRRHVQGREGGGNVVLDPSSPGYTEGGTVSFPFPGLHGEAGSGDIGTATFDGGFELALPGGDSLRSLDDGGYRWTDNGGNFLSVDGKTGTITMQSSNGDWRTMVPGGGGAEGNVYGEEPSTDWPEFSDVVDPMDGAITNPDGSVVTTNERGDIDVQGVGGSSFYRDSQSGEMVSMSRDGLWSLSDGDGQSVIGHLALDGPPPVGQGTLEKDTLSPDDKETTTLPNGTEQTEFGDGSTYLSHPDDSSEFHRDGAHVYTDPDGRITWRGDGIEPGKSSVEEVVAGSLVRTDGLEEVFGADVAREFNLTGGVVGAGGGGGVSHEEYEGGGTVTTDHDTGEIVLDDGNGRVRHYDASGEITEGGGRDAWNW